jgi:hypothetical protein
MGISLARDLFEVPRSFESCPKGNCENLDTLLSLLLPGNEMSRFLSIGHYYKAQHLEDWNN